MPRSRLANLEAEFSEPWSREARMVLPSTNSELHPGAVWGPVLAFVVLQGIAEAIGGKETAATALALFDRLRLREPWRGLLRRRRNHPGRLARRGPGPVGFPGADVCPSQTKTAGETDSPASPRNLGRMAMPVGCSVSERAGESGTSTRSFTSRCCGGRNCRICLQLAAGAGSGNLSAGEQRRNKPFSAAALSTEAVEQRIKQAGEQAEEAGFRIGKEKGSRGQAARKREKGALAKP